MVNYKYNYQLFYGGFYYESKNEKIQCIASILHSAFFNYSMPEKANSQRNYAVITETKQQFKRC